LGQKLKRIMVSFQPADKQAARSRDSSPR